ncbi:hypothetical protein [Neobacillus sp. PS3-40]|uniref:hypothetical protein n=1 Tax=Neobacillus sp. PS3-40 TaxID=3070679 RepID=UPI0027DF8DF9|nr:hypothetical protein [Neobacillus sp. PS3-40]WML44636.1 hypothetical protein RCG20_01610 [Neobacillus sp. PS3-40]
MVLKVEIRRPRIDDIKELNFFFRLVIADTFIKEGLGEILKVTGSKSLAGGLPVAILFYFTNSQDC